MLLSLTGASGVGKSTALDAIAEAFEGRPVTCVEFDSVGVPPGADTVWRHRVLERWVRRAVEEQREGRDFVLCGQVPVGELLAAGDPRWAFEVIDTDSMTREQTAQRAVAWARDTLAGRLPTPLTGAWWTPDEARGARSRSAR